MNKTAIKNFAIWARNKLIADISYRAGLMGITENGIASALPQSTGDTEFYEIGTAEPYAIRGEEIRQRRKLAEVIQRKEADSGYAAAFKYIIEEVAYTWFNRLIAVRFMEVNDYLPSRIRVLSSETGKLEPDLVTNPFDSDLEFTPAEEEALIGYKQNNQLDEAFRLLFRRQCNALHEILPVLFETTSDYTELLLNLSIIDQEGVVYHLVHDISEDDFNIEKGGQVEIIGWLYQYYNTEPKADAFAKKGKITKEEIPAVTQLFTPDWIVRYMVENSLGRLWISGQLLVDSEEWSERERRRIAKEKELAERMGWKYYLPEAEQEPEVRQKLNKLTTDCSKLVTDPTGISFADICAGSGHILVYAFDVLMQIYESAGYSERDAAQSILEHNLYGLDIDDRAAQLAYFAVMMKARQYDRRIFSRGIEPHVYAIQESNTVNRAQLKYFGAGMSELERNTAAMQLEGLLDTLVDAKEYGSILTVENYDWALLRRFADGAVVSGQLSVDSMGLEETAAQVKQLIDIGETMARKYWVTCTNPPYANMGKMNAKLNSFVQKNFADYKSDLFSAFVVKCAENTKENGYCGFLTPYVWMFIQSYEKMRQYLYTNATIETLIQFEYSAFEEATVPICTFAFKKGYVPKKGCYLRLTDFRGGMEVQRKKSLEAINNHDCGYYYEQCADNFSKIPGSPVAYWVSMNFFNIFDNPKLFDYTFSDGQNKTGNNDKYLRCFWEVDSESVGKGKHWVQLAKGGGFRKWYGNIINVIDWSLGAREHYRKDHVSRIIPEYIWYKEGITWGDITSYKPSFRVLPQGMTFETAGLTLFPKDSESEYYILGLLNTCIFDMVSQTLNATFHTKIKDVQGMPYVVDAKQSVHKLVEENISMSKADWDSFETSWDFLRHPLVPSAREKQEQLDSQFASSRMEKFGRISWHYDRWEEACEERFNQLKANEEELNRIFIDIYGLQDELTPEVEDKDVTVRRADLTRDIRSLLSYAVGCMFGRYSVYKDGLLFAGESYSEKAFMEKVYGQDSGRRPLTTDHCFTPDADNIIPITDEEYLEDDIVALLCEWLKDVYGADTLEANLDFIAKALGNKGNTSREIIRNYFLNDFFKDHCQTYSVTGSGKRPIYWLFDSGRQNGFKALIYLHRYTPDDIGNLRIDYLHRMQRVYESEMGRMQDMIDHSTNAREAAAAAKRKEKLAKQLKECREYDEKIGHLALSRIELDLDDGVKVNYRKLQTAQDGRFYEVLADSKNIMGKQ